MGNVAGYVQATVEATKPKKGRFFKGQVVVSTGLDFTASVGVSPTKFGTLRGSGRLSLEPYLETKLFAVNRGSCDWDYELSVKGKTDIGLNMDLFSKDSAETTHTIWEPDHKTDFGKDCRDDEPDEDQGEDLDDELRGNTVIE